MHIVDYDRCPICSQEAKSLMHVPQNCQESSNVWMWLVLPRYWVKFFSSQDTQWILENISNERGQHEGLKWSLIFGITIYNLWVDRNHKVLKDKRIDGDLVMRILGHAREICQAEADNSLHLERQKCKEIDCD